MTGEGGVAVACFLFFGLEGGEGLFDVHVVFVFLVVEYFLQFDLWFDEELDEDAFGEGVYLGDGLVHGEVEASAAATDEEYFVVFVGDEAVVDVGVGEVSVVE